MKESEVNLAQHDRGDADSHARHGSEYTDVGDLNPQHFKHASEIAIALARACKSRRLYSDNSPVPRASVERLFSNLTDYLRDNDTLTFSITETEFVFHSKAVYSNPDRRESLAFRLYRDGVRTLIFHNGITQDEILGLLEILARIGVEKEDSDNDVITQMWERDFTYITYLAVDECIDPETPDGPPSGSGQPCYGPPSTLEEESGNSMCTAAMMDLPLTDEERESIADVTLTEDELEEIGQQVLAEEKENPRKRVFQILMEIFQGATGTEVKADVFRGIQALFMEFLDAGNPAEAAGLLREIKGLVARSRITSEAGLAGDLEKTLQNFLEMLGQERQLLRIEPRIEEAAPHELEEYEQYLCELLPNSVGPLCGMLGRIKNKRAREMTCRVLSVLGKDNLGALIDLLSDPRWYLVRNLVYVLRIMRDERALPYLETLLMHQDARVRMEVVLCIAEFEGEESQILMRRCLRDPERVVRAVAAKRMGQIGGSRAASFIVECILEKAFRKRPLDEKWEFFEALGHAGSDETIPILDKLLRKRSIFRSSEACEMRKCSAAALARIGTPAAIEVLERLAQKKNPDLRRACSEALRFCSRRKDG